MGILYDNLFNGLALLLNSNGNFYYGIVQDNIPEEKGIYKIKSKFFVGTFFNGKIEGIGLLIVDKNIMLVKKILRNVERG